jgi:hypothetical protein
LLLECLIIERKRFNWTEVTLRIEHAND